MTREEIRNREQEQLKERKENEQKEIEDSLKKSLASNNITVTALSDEDENYNIMVSFDFILDGYTQRDEMLWKSYESIDEFTEKVKSYINYIKQLREKYPKYSKQNDYIQTNRHFNRHLELTHMGYKRDYDFTIDLADYMKLPNKTSTGFGGGDYEIKRTPQRVEEYNNNIDKTINFLIDCITELKQRKYKEIKQ